MASTPLKYLNQYILAALNVGGGIDNSQTTGIVLQSVTGLDITKAGVALLTYADPINTSTAEWITYTSINGSNELQGVVRGAEGFSAKAHLNQAVVAFPLSESHINDLNAMFDSTGADFAQIATPASPSSGRNKIYPKSDGKFYTLTSAGVEAPVATDPRSSLYQNAIINGNFDVFQRGTAFTSASTPANNDDTFLADRWNVISDGNDAADISQEAITDLPGSNYAYKLDVETAKRSGLVQLLEAKDAQKFKGKNVSISFAVKSANISAIRATVLSWSSTADSVTSDVVGTWAATPTWAANWADNATPADLTVTSSWTTVSVQNIAIDEATVNNLALVIWLPNEETIGDIVYISQVQMNEGATASAFQPKSYDAELFACQRYCYAPPTPGTGSLIGFGMCVSNAIARIFVHFPNTMRGLPALTATAGDYQIDDTTAGTDVTVINNTGESTWNTTRMNNLQIQVSGTPFTAQRACSLKCDGTANRLMIFDAEL